MSKPRNPRYFPHMKVRGARRRRIAPIQRMAGAFDSLSMTAWQAVVVFDGLARVLKGAA